MGIADVDNQTQTTTEKWCLWGCLTMKLFLWRTMRLPTEGLFSKGSEFLTWVGSYSLRMVPPQRLGLLCLACELFTSASYLWTTATLTLTCVPITVSYRTETGHTLKEDLNLIDSTRFQIHFDSVFVKEWWNERKQKCGTWSDYLDNTLIDRTKCSANNFPWCCERDRKCDRNESNEAQRTKMKLQDKWP